MEEAYSKNSHTRDLKILWNLNTSGFNLNFLVPTSCVRVNNDYSCCHTMNSQVQEATIQVEHHNYEDLEQPVLSPISPIPSSLAQLLRLVTPRVCRYQRLYRSQDSIHFDGIRDTTRNPACPNTKMAAIAMLTTNIKSSFLPNSRVAAIVASRGHMQPQLHPVCIYLTHVYSGSYCCCLA